jgi:IS605 OrfB family transposase
MRDGFIYISADTPSACCREEALSPLLRILPSSKHHDILSDMKLVAQIKLLPNTEQYKELATTLTAANNACTFVSEQAWHSKIFKQYNLHHLCYKVIRSRFGLSAQIAVRVIAKVADAYKLDKKTKRTFKPSGSIAYDDRILSWRLSDSSVSIWTLSGRIRIPFVCGSHQKSLLASRKGESDLSCRKGIFYLAATCDIKEPEQIKTTDAIGVDLGIKNIAVDFDGVVHSSSMVNNVRHRYRRLRTRLQTTCSKSAKRKLKRLSGKESRFAKDMNHCISKKLVAKAKDTKHALALEDLTGIRMRITVSRHRRATLSGWSFGQLRAFTEYKALREGIPVIFVDPRNTSRTCPECGHIVKHNRINQRLFSCTVCGFAGLADHIAAINIRRAAVNPPIVARADAKASTAGIEAERSYKPPQLAAW